MNDTYGHYLQVIDLLNYIRNDELDLFCNKLEKIDFDEMLGLLIFEIVKEDKIRYWELIAKKIPILKKDHDPSDNLLYYIRKDHDHFKERDGINKTFIAVLKTLIIYNYNCDMIYEILELKDRYDVLEEISEVAMLNLMRVFYNCGRCDVIDRLTENGTKITISEKTVFMDGINISLRDVLGIYGKRYLNKPEKPTVEFAKLIFNNDDNFRTFMTNKLIDEPIRCNIRDDDWKLIREMETAFEDITEFVLSDFDISDKDFVRCLADKIYIKSLGNYEENVLAEIIKLRKIYKGEIILTQKPADNLIEKLRGYVKIVSEN